MPTLNPRLTITLQPQLAAQLRRLSELTGNSQSKLISEMLEGSGPVFDRMIVVLSAAEDAKQAMKGRMAADMEQAQGRMEQQLGLVLDDFNTVTGTLLEEAEAIKRRARRAPGVGPSLRRASAGRAPLRSEATPLSNRGVRSTKTKPNVSKKGGR